jgi:hypothetical protein
LSVSNVKREIQSDEKENKPAQQIIGHVVAESYVNKPSMHGRRKFVVSNINHTS